MGRQAPNRLPGKQLAVWLLLWNTTNAQSGSPSQNVTEVTATTTSDGSTITQVFTPSAASISGLEPPITAATTITTTDTAGETVAIAVAAGAGAVAGGGLAAWLFKPVPGAPPAPTEPPPYRTETQDSEPKTTTDPTTTSTSTSTSSTEAACPFPTSGYPISFAPVESQAQWTVEIPKPSTVSSYSPECTQQGDNKELLRGTTPDYINALAEVFCDKDLSSSQTATLGQSDLPDDSSWKKSGLDGVRVDFGFEHKLSNSGCKENCKSAYSSAVLLCQYNSHVIYGGGSLEQGCGKYTFAVDADVNTELTCNDTPNPVSSKYSYRQAAVDRLDDFCGGHDGDRITESDPSTDIREGMLSITTASDCRGSGSYTISKDTCVKYFMETIDGCSKETTIYKHGGTVTDTDNCVAFGFKPTNADYFACYPENKDAGYITAGTHVAVSPDTAKDAIAQFCDRQGNGQKYTLDPDKIPDSGSFIQDTCTTDGYASCGYSYNKDGSRADGINDGGVLIRMEALYMNPNDQYTCAANTKYEIHGARCHEYLEKVIGTEPKGVCVGDDPSKLDLGTFLENGDKGCVVWNMWAVET